MAELLGGVEVEAIVNRFCRVLLAEISGLRHTGDKPLNLRVSDSGSTRSILVNRDVDLEKILGDYWKIAHLSQLNDKWAALDNDPARLYFVSVSMTAVPETTLEKGTAFRMQTKREGKTLVSVNADSVIRAFRGDGTISLPRPDMEPPWVEETWVDLVSLLAASRVGRSIELGPIISSAAFWLTSRGDHVGEQTMQASANITANSALAEAEARQLQEDVQSICGSLRARQVHEHAPGTPRQQRGAVSALVEAILGEQIYPREEEARLRYLRLWQALADLEGTNLGEVEALSDQDAPALDDVRRRIAHPSRLPSGMDGEQALMGIRQAAFIWIKRLSKLQYSLDSRHSKR